MGDDSNGPEFCLSILSAALLVAIAVTTSAAVSPRTNIVINKPSEYTLLSGGRSAETATWGYSESSAYYTGTGVGNSSTTYVCTLYLAGRSQGQRTCPVNTPARADWRSLLRDRSMEWITRNNSGVDITLRPGRQYATY